jgi:RNA polymerase primary sigma factor
LPLSDLISEGNIGLINAIERFDPDKGYHFISYAVWWIRQAITKAIYEKARMIRLPQNRIFELSRIEKTRTRLQSEKGKDPGVGDVAKALNMDETHVASMLNISRDHVSKLRSARTRILRSSATSWRIPSETPRRKRRWTALSGTKSTRS